MITSYNEILNEMRNDYFNKCNKPVDMLSEQGARLQAVASELFSLACYGDFVLKQAFVQTATGKYLENHAAMRSIYRKKATKSYGKLRFYCSEDCTQKVKIPKGTICSVSDNAYCQFVTTEEGVIDPAVNKYVDVSAESINYGYENNVDTNSITVIVNPPTSVNRVENTEKFVGGMDDETDISLRERVLNSYSVPPTGFSSQSFCDAVLTCEGVLDCVVRIVDDRVIEICIETCDGKITPEIEYDIKNKLFLNKLFVSQIYITVAKPINYSLSIEVYKDDSINANMDDNVRNAIKEIANSIGIEQNVKLSRFVSAISNIDGVRYCEVNSDSAIQNVIYADKNVVLKNNIVKVAYYD